MKIGKWAWVMLAAAPFLAGCGDFWEAPQGSSSTGSGGSCTTNCSTSTSGDFYILNQGTTPQIAGYSIVSGTLTPLTGSPYSVAAPPYAIAIAPNGSFLYVSTANGVYLYTIGKGGALGTATSVSGQPASAIRVDSTNAWLIEAITLSNATGVELDALPLTSTGAAAGSAQTVTFTIPSTSVNQMAISPDNNNIFVALGAGGTIVVPFNATSATGPLSATYTNINVANSGGTSLSVAVDYANRVFYIGETLANSAANSGGVRLFNYTTLKEVSGSPYASGGLTPNAILPGVDFTYVANEQASSSAGNITGFKIAASGATYSLTLGTTTAAGIDPVGLAQDNTDTYVMVVNSDGSPYFKAFIFDSNTAGALDSQVTANTGATPIAIAAMPASQ